MKKIRFLLLAVAILSSLLVCSQQRLVSLPSSMGYGGNSLPGLCIDLLKNGPYKQEYSAAGGGSTSIFVESASRLKPQPGKTYDQAEFWSPNKEAVSEYYKRFIREKIAEYGRKDGPMDSKRHGDLQDEIWAYNGMDELGGFIDTNASDQLAEFAAAKKKFQERYGLEVNEANSNRRVWGKVSQLNSIKKYPPHYTPPQSIRFTEQGITCTTGNVTHTVQVSYEGVSFSEVSGMSAQIDNAVHRYGDTYYKLPDRANLSNYPEHEGVFLLSLSDTRAVYKMNFSLPNDLLGIKVIIVTGSRDYCLAK